MTEQYSGNEDGTLGLCFIGSLMFYLNKNQCFVDGNKRTSLIVGLKLLANLGLTLNITNEEMEAYAVRMATDLAMKSSDVVVWISEKSVQEKPKAVSLPNSPQTEGRVFRDL